MVITGVSRGDSFTFGKCLRLRNGITIRLSSPNLSDRQHPALKRYLKCMDRFRQGKTLDQQYGNNWDEE